MAANVNFEAKTTWVQDEIVYPADANRWEKGIKDCADLVNDHNARIPAVEAELAKKVSKSGDTMTGSLYVSKNSIPGSFAITNVPNGGYGDFAVRDTQTFRIGSIRVTKSEDGNTHSLFLNVHKPGEVDAGPTSVINCSIKADGTVRLEGVTPPSSANDTRLTTTAWVRTFVNSLIGDTGGGVVVPVGALMMGPVGSMAGYLLCDGRAVSRTQYSALFAAIGVNFGAGDGSSTFNVPDYRGCFLRMTGGSAGTMYQKQPQGLPNITGEASLDGNSKTGAFKDKGADGSLLHDGWKYQNTIVSFSAATSNSIYGAANEVRPVNFAVNYFIKY